jgi:transposase
MSKPSMICAGIDTSKRKLDAALAGRADELSVDNSPDGYQALAAWLRRHDVERVGIEASGGYEQAGVVALRRDGFEVVVFQPAQVRAYARFLLQRAKNDKIDAGLIADCTAAISRVHAPPDPRLAPLARHLTMIEQIIEDIARIKTRREFCRDEPHILAHWMKEIARLQGSVRDELKHLVAAVQAHGDLARRLELINSVEGVGLKTALAILLRMPEIGRVEREVAAALAGLAPYDNDSGDHHGGRHIAGGRARLRGALFAAALPAAFRWNTQLMALYRRLIGRGKPHKVALVACARKLLIYVNTVVARGTPWMAESEAAAS